MTMKITLILAVAVTFLVSSLTSAREAKPGVPVDNQ